LNVRFAPKLTELMRCREMSRSANSVISRCNKRFRHSSTRRRVRRIVGTSKRAAKPALFIDWRLTRQCAVAEKCQAHTSTGDILAKARGRREADGGIGNSRSSWDVVKFIRLSSIGNAYSMRGSVRCEGREVLDSID